MLENTILSHFAFNEEYSRKVIPFILPEYFGDNSHKVMFSLIRAYIEKYNNLPTREALNIELSSLDNINSAVYESTLELLKELSVDDTELQWLLDKTEQFCQERALYNAITDSIKIMDNQSSHSRGAIPKLLSDALGVSFNSNIGHDFFEHRDDRYEFYHKKEERIPFDIDLLNKITKGGVPKKTLNIIMGGVGCGKSLTMCHFASHNLMMGYNVLYITMEMAEERIAERIDANLLDTGLDELILLPRSTYAKKMQRTMDKTTGKLYIKQFPTGAAHVGHFRHLLNELRLKKNFTADIIYVDYLNICASSRVKQGTNTNSYTYVKSIAEEIRGLAVEFNVPIITATQLTRSGFSNSDPGLEDTSESFGTTATADFMFAVVTSEQLESLNQLMIKQLKNRYGDPTFYKRFVVGVDRTKMRLYDVEQMAQNNIVDDDGPSFDKTRTGKTVSSESKDKFSTLKY